MKPSPANFVKDFTDRTVKTPTSASPTECIGSNANRFAIVFAHFDGGVIQIAPISSNAIPMPVFFIGENEHVKIKFKDYGSLVSSAWFCATAGAPGSICITEVVYQPKGC